MASWLPADHLAWFVISVVDELDMTRFEASAKLGGVGREGYDPRMLLALLIYGYGCGQRSSRQIERLCSVDVAFRIICVGDVPDHTTVARFRACHDAAVAEVFTQVLRMCARAGLGRVGVVALDGTKIAANASRQASRDEDWLRAEAARIVAEAGAVDAAEDDLYGEDRRGDEMPPEWSDPRTRGARIRSALDDLDREAAERAAEQHQQDPLARARAEDYQRRMTDPTADPADRHGGHPPTGVDRVATAQAQLDRLLAAGAARVADRQAREEAAAAQGRLLCGARPVDVEHTALVRKARDHLAQMIKRRTAAAAATSSPPPVPVRRRNLTDPDSRLMKSPSGWVQGYNAQLVVSDDQIILAVEATQSPADVESYQPMVAAAQAAVTDMFADMFADVFRAGPAQTEPVVSIGVVVADAGYLSEANLRAPGPDRLIALGKRRQVEQQAREDPTEGPPPPEATPVEAMGHRLRTPEGMSIYRRRGVTVEPVNGHVKDRVGLRQFARRGHNAVNAELHLAASVANLMKIYRIGLLAT